jgi:hypothetical protein
MGLSSFRPDFTMLHHFRRTLVAFLLLGALGAQAAVACESGHWIKSVTDDGSVIVLEDGSVWLIDDVSRIDTALWLPLTEIVVCPGKLINTDDGETADARRLR